MCSAVYEGISDLYARLLDSLQHVVRVFRKKDGSPKRSLRVAASIAWKPFEIRFGELLDDIKVHQNIVNAQIQVLLYANVKNVEGDVRKVLEIGKSREAMQKLLEDIIKHMRERSLDGTKTSHESKASFVVRLRQWIHPPEFTLLFESASDSREAGTSEWLFDNPVYMRWKEMAAEPHLTWANDMVLRVQGNPGSGKTVLAASTIQNLRSTHPDENICYFFFRANDPDYERPEGSYRSILAQTLQFHRNDPCLMEKFNFVSEEKSSGQAIVSIRELLDLIKLCAIDGYIHSILLDGVDECTDWRRLLHPLSGLHASLCETSTKLALFSRPHIGFGPLLSGSHVANTGQSAASDIGLLIQRRLERFVDEALLPVDADITELGRRLQTGADYMILWAHLMLDYLASDALTISQRIAIIQSVILPEGLDETYDRIVEALLKRRSAEQQLAKWLIMWLVFAKRPLSCTELHASTRLMNPEKVTTADFTNIEHTIISTCASLVERNQVFSSARQGIVPGYRLIHLSAVEYFQARLSEIAVHDLGSN